MIDNLVIVYSNAGHSFYEGLAQRLAVACAEHTQEAMLCKAGELGSLCADQLRDATLAVVNPHECSYTVGDRDTFFSRLSVARKTVIVLAEAVETQWFRHQFQLPVRYDALIDVGFVSQEDKLRDFEVPYRFLFNGPTQQEEETIAHVDSSQRCIPWAMVGHQRENRIRLAAELMEGLDPRGLVFLPDAGVLVRKGRGMIGPLGLTSALSRTNYYIWNSHHTFMYYESFRFIEAILAGAVPCKIDDKAVWEALGIPGVFPSARALRDSIQSEGFASMQASAKEFYLSRGSLADHLEEVLENV